MSNTWFISDTHFHHKNILKYAPTRVEELAKYLINKKNRFYSSIEEAEKDITSIINSNDSKKIDYILDMHDNMIIDYWNSVVKPKDTVWFLGDLCLTDRTKISAIMKRLNGSKKMIKGNHDSWSDEFYYNLGFEFVSKYPVILKHKFVLSHAPLSLDICNNSPLMFIYGHTHDKPCELTRLLNTRCACIEVNNFMPFRITEFDNAQ